MIPSCYYGLYKKPPGNGIDNPFGFDYVSSTEDLARYFSFINEGYERIPGPDWNAIDVYEKEGKRGYRPVETVH